jgi:RHS repeat-associated protein
VKTEFVSVKDAAGNLVRTAIKDYNYDKNGNVTQVAEYDWVAYSSIPRDATGKPAGIPGGLTPKRVTANTYARATPDASDTTTDDPDVYHKTTSPNLRNAIESSEARTDLSGSLASAASRIEYTYDNPATTGNLITEKSWDSTKGAVTRPLGPCNPSPCNAILVTHQYDAYGNRLRTYDANNVRTEYIYGAVNFVRDVFLTDVISAFGTSVQRTIRYDYDFWTGARTKTIDANNNVITVTTYDVFGRPTLVEEADGTTIERQTSTQYSDTARRVVVRADLDAVGDGKLVTVHHFDQLGRIRLSRQLENPNDDVTNESLGIKVQTRYFAGTTAYPNVYQLVSNPYRASTSSAAGSEGTMGWSRTRLDKGGRVIEVKTFNATLPEPWGGGTGSTGAVVTEYDAEFNKVTDQAGKVRRSMIDGLGRLVRVDEPDLSGNLGTTASPNQPTSYTYSVLNNLTQVIQGAQTRTFVYSSLSRLTSAINPESGTTTYQYDNNGNMLSKSDARPVTTTITYDVLNRPKTKTYSCNTPSVSYVYDNQPLPSGSPAGFNRGFAVGRLVAVNYGNNSSAGSYYGYDELGRIVRKTQQINGNNYAVTASYNRASAMTSETYPSNRTVNYSYDNAGRLSTFSGTLGDGVNRTYATVAQYSAAGLKERESYGTAANGMTTPLYLKLHYNRRLQMVDLRLGSVNDEWNNDRGTLVFYYGTNAIANSNPFLDDTDNNGNVRRHMNYVPTPTGGEVIPQLDDYTYDSLNRISSLTEWQRNESLIWTPNVVTQNFSYDRYGNRWVTSATGGVSSYQPTYNTSNNRINGLGYDPVGNITSDPATGGTMIYDGENRMLMATNGGGAVYTYDGEGKRVKRMLAGGQEWWYVYGIGGELLAEYLSTAPTTVKKEYGYRSGQLLVVWDTDKSGDERLKWLVTDHLGSTRMEADKSGSLAGMRRHDYAPFGEELYAGIRRNGSGQGQYGYEPPQSSVRLRFGSKERDIETGLDYFGARYYASVQGRFTSADPIALSSERLLDPQGINLYSYARNNPLNIIDPDGEDYTEVTEETFSLTIERRAQSKSGELIRQVRVDVKVKVTKKFGEYGNVIDVRSEATATATNTDTANIRLTQDQLDTIGKTTAKIVEVADVIGVDRAEALGIGARETFLGSDVRRGAADFQQPAVNPLQLSGSSGISPTTDLGGNVKSALGHYKRVGLQGYGPGPNNPGGSTYVADTTGYINQIKAGISGSIRTSSHYSYSNYYIYQQEFRRRPFGEREFKGRPYKRLP